MKTIIKFIFLLISLNSILNESFVSDAFNTNCGPYCDCGAPARPPETIVYLTNKKLLYNKSQIYYENQSKVKYKCLDSNNLLIGSDTRTCLSGKWMGTVPKCAINLKNNIRLLSIELLRSDSQTTTLEISRSDEFYNTGIYSVPYYIKPRDCAEWTVGSVDEMWVFHLNQFVDINYIQIVLYSKQNLQNILFSNRIQTLKLIISTSPSPELLCQLLRKSYKRNYLTLDYSCGSQQSLNQRIDSLTLDYKSRQLFKTFSIALCQLRVYQMPVDCGSPDYTLSTTTTNQIQEVFSYRCNDKNYVIEGNSHITCNHSTVRWTGETPICVPKPYCKLIDNIFGTKIIITYEEINLLENGENVVFDGKLAYLQCNGSNSRNKNFKSDTQVICRKGQWFGMASLPSCEQTSELQSNGESKRMTDQMTIILMGSIIGILIIPTILLIKRSMRKKIKEFKQVIYDDTDNCEEHYYAEIDYWNIKEKIKCDEKFDSLKSSTNSERNKNIYVESVV